MNGVLLIDPRFAFNVGGALRASSIFGAEILTWTGSRVPSMDDWPPGARLPREERMKAYARVRIFHESNWIDALAHMIEWGMTPVCVELMENAENLIDFVHPEEAVYVFGPEDGGVPKGARINCHRFVRIPSDECLNLAAAVNVVLYDRIAKQCRKEEHEELRSGGDRLALHGGRGPGGDQD